MNKSPTCNCFADNLYFLSNNLAGIGLCQNPHGDERGKIPKASVKQPNPFGRWK